MSKKSNSKSKAAKVNPPVAGVVTTKTPRVSTNGKQLGRPPGSNSTSLVSIKALLEKLTDTAQVPIGTRFLREFNIQSEAPFVSTGANLKSLVEKYKTTTAVVTDLNQPEPVVS